MPVAEQAARAVRQRQLAARHLHLGGCASPRSWRTASITLVMPPRLAGWLLQSPPPSVLKGSLPTPLIRLPSATKLAALALLAEAEILDLHQHGDGEAVVDRGVLDVRRASRRLPRRRAAPDRARGGVGQVDAGRPAWFFVASPAPSTFTSGRFSDFAISGRVTISAPPPSEMTQQSRRCSGSATMRRVHHLLHRHDLPQHGVRVVLRVVAGGDLDPGELLGRSCRTRACGARAHGVGVGDRARHRDLERVVRACSAPRTRGTVPVAMAFARGRPASVISATLQRPRAIACAAWPTCMT